MKRPGSFLGGSTVVRQGSDWFSRQDDPESEDYTPEFSEILAEYISEEIVPELVSDQARIKGKIDTPSLGSNAILGNNTKSKTARLYVPAHEGPAVAPSRENSPFKRTRSKPVVIIRAKLRDA